MKKRSDLNLQGYPRMANGLLSESSLFPILNPPMKKELILEAIDNAFKRCMKNKQGKAKELIETPEHLVKLCIKHLKERSDPIISPFFVSQIKVDELFELDAISHEMQRYRMTIGVFYQYLLLELMKQHWPVFDGYKEGDIVADVVTPGFVPGLRLYISVKKSVDTVGGQDIKGVIHRLEDMAKSEKNLTSPYMCVICVATPAGGKLRNYTDRYIKRNKDNQPYSLNCEYWGPGFIFPYVCGREATEIYKEAISRVSQYLPFMSLKFRKLGIDLFKQELSKLDLLHVDGTIHASNFLNFITGKDPY